MARSRQVSKALDPMTDSSGGWPMPQMNSGMLMKDVGSSGLRAYGGWVREEFLRALQGREAQRVYREMGDNSAVVGAIMFAIVQVMRKVEWRETPANDSAKAAEMAEFARSIRYDMSDPWEAHVVEALSMLQFGFAPCEIVYKRRLGQRGNAALRDEDASSKFDDGKIGIRRLPLRGQETILKWFFDDNGRIKGLTQQPWIGSLVDLPIEKLLLYRPTQHKGNPEGRSILRTAYRPYYFMKRIEELEAILFERMGGLPVVRVPNALLEAAKGSDADAAAALDAYKKLAQNVRADEQMGIVMPSDVYRDANGSPTSQKMYDFELKTPDSSALRVDSDKVIRRYAVDILKAVLADFIDLGHQARGTQNLAITKVDMFYTAIMGWSMTMTSVHNRYLLPRLWALNAFDFDLMPEYRSDLPQRIDLATLGKFIDSVVAAGMPLFPDRDLENYIRGAAGLPELSEDAAEDPARVVSEEMENQLEAAGAAPAGGPEDVAKHVLGLAALRRRRAQLAGVRPARIESSVEVDAAARRANLEPTVAQREAGNYRMGHVRLHGLDFTIETPSGALRRGVGRDGEPWSSVMPAHYGYLRRSKPGADGEAIDAYVGPHPHEETAWVIDQLDPETGEFDEHKLFVGFASLPAVIATYRSAFSDGKADARIGAVHRVSIAGLRAWARGNDTASPVGSLVGKTRDPKVKLNGHFNGEARA